VQTHFSGGKPHIFCPFSVKTHSKPIRFAAIFRNGGIYFAPPVLNFKGGIE